MKKLSYYYNTKDKEAEYLKSQIVYEVCCPVYKSKHIGKTDRNFGARAQKSLVYNHLLEWERFNYVVNLHSLPPSGNLVEYSGLVKIVVYYNSTIIDNSPNWIELYFLESLHIKWKKTKVNCGLKATKELVLFS